MCTLHANAVKEGPEASRLAMCNVSTASRSRFSHHVDLAVTLREADHRDGVGLG
jgi:hypothetical protein